MSVRCLCGVCVCINVSPGVCVYAYKCLCGMCACLFTSPCGMCVYVNVSGVCVSPCCVHRVWCVCLYLYGVVRVMCTPVQITADLAFP